MLRLVFNPAISPQSYYDDSANGIQLMMPHTIKKALNIRKRKNTKPLILEKCRETTISQFCFNPLNYVSFLNAVFKPRTSNKNEWDQYIMYSPPTL